jgi:VWFA-related protein
MRPDPRRPLLLFLVLLSALPLFGFVRPIPFEPPLDWPEEHRAFLQDGPGWLLDDAEFERFLELDEDARGRFIAEFLGRDPDPETPENELAEGIRNRRRLVTAEFLTYLDDRARLLFLHGAPNERETVDCPEVFKPLELWNYGPPDAEHRLVLYRPAPETPWRLWLPVDSKRRLYNPEMEYWLEQWEELRNRLYGRRFDRQICDMARTIDKVTGIDGLFGFEPDRPTTEWTAAHLAPPDDLAAWARQAAATEPPGPPPLAETAEVELFYPQREGLRLLTQALVRLPAGTEVKPFVEGEKAEIRLSAEGLLEREGKIFSRFRLRFQLPVPEEGSEQPLALVVNRRLRPQEEFLLRLRIEEETSGRQLLLSRAVEVPAEPDPGTSPTLREVLAVVGQDDDQPEPFRRGDLVILPPESDVIFGLWRVEALVTGDQIEKVAFFLDGEQILARRRPPYTAELRLATYPTEQVVRVEGYDAEDNLIASDEVVLNQPRGELQVRILQPEQGRTFAAGPAEVQAEVVVPEEKKVREVQFLVNEELQATLEQPPWNATVQVPAEELVYLTVTAVLDDGSRAESVRFLRAPDYVEEIDVDLVELYTTVTDSSGRPVKGLGEEDFRVIENGRVQEIAKFQLVENLPLTLGIAIDTSGSMFESLGEAQRAATGFLENIITPRDRCFALSFDDRPRLLMPRTSDVGAVAARLEDLTSGGATSLHDAIVTSLYYYRGIRGRRALVLLSDGEDTSSTLEFSEALEYARRSGVAIYTIGLRIGFAQIGVRRKLENLAQETGGRTFHIGEASELAGVYEEIERELRSQYLVAYNSTLPDGERGFREVEVEVRGGKLKARTIRGYYP